MLKSFHCPKLRPVRHYDAEFSMKLVLKTEPGINYREPVTKHYRNDAIIACKIRSIVKILPFPPPYVITVWFQKLKRRNECCLPVHRTVGRKWWGRWRFSRSEAFRVRVWYTLWEMLRHIAWTSWNRIAKKRHTRNILFALKMGDFLSSVSAFSSGSFKSREKWSFV